MSWTPFQKRNYNDHWKTVLAIKRSDNKIQRPLNLNFNWSINKTTFTKMMSVFIRRVAIEWVEDIGVVAILELSCKSIENVGVFVAVEDVGETLNSSLLSRAWRLNCCHACAYGRVDEAVSGGKPHAGKGVVGFFKLT